MKKNESTQVPEAMPHRTYKRQVKNLIVHRPMQREFSFMLIALFMVASVAIAWGCSASSMLYGSFRECFDESSRKVRVCSGDLGPRRAR